MKSLRSLLLISGVQENKRDLDNRSIQLASDRNLDLKKYLLLSNTANVPVPSELQNLVKKPTVDRNSDLTVTDTDISFLADQFNQV